MQSTAATGTGIAAWLDTVYEVSDSGVRQVGSYLGEGKYCGESGFAAKAFSGRLVSCEIKDGRATLKVSYTVEYYDDHGTQSFKRKKTVVLSAALGHQKAQTSDIEEQMFSIL